MQVVPMKCIKFVEIITSVYSLFLLIREFVFSHIFEIFYIYWNFLKGTDEDFIKIILQIYFCI